MMLLQTLFKLPLQTPRKPDCADKLGLQSEAKRSQVIQWRARRDALREVRNRFLHEEAEALERELAHLSQQSDSNQSKGGNVSPDWDLQQQGNIAAPVPLEPPVGDAVASTPTGNFRCLRDFWFWLDPS